MKRLALAALLVPLAALAEIHIEETLEWLADSHPHIALAEVAGAEDRWKPGDEGARADHQVISVKTTKALKGHPPAGAAFSARLFSPNELPKKGDELLLFLDEGQKAARVIDLAFRADWEHAYTKDFGVLRSRAAVLAVVEARVRQPGSGRSLRLEVDEKAPAFKTLWSGSACYLIVPADPEFKALLMERARSKDPWERGRAAFRLAAYPGEDTLKRLREMLLDAGESHITRKGADIPVWPVRQGAYLALVALGEKVEKPEGFSENVTAFLEW